MSAVAVQTSPSRCVLSVAARRRAQRLGVWNAAVWSLGNGLASTTLIVYLAYELAAPQVVGLLRMAAPTLIGRLADRKRFCIGAFFLSTLLLAALPWLAAPGRLSSPQCSLWALIGLWCGYHLLQYLGTVALWSWLADIAPRRVRGRYLGWRERWLVVGHAVGAVCAGLFAWGFLQTHAAAPRWMAYAVPAMTGAAYMLAALVPLLRMPAATGAPQPRRAGRTVLAPLTDARFLRLLCYGCWFSFFNGATQAAQNLYPLQVLGISLFLALALQTGMRLGQAAVSPTLGRLADRWGNRPVMIVCQLLVAAGLLGYAWATRESWWWYAIAWALWIAYAGLNICLPNLLLRLAPGEKNTPHIAVFYAITGVCYAASTIVGGLAVDGLRGLQIPLFNSGIILDFYSYLFVFGFGARCLGAGLLLWIVVEPAPLAERGRRAEEAAK